MAPSGSSGYIPLVLLLLVITTTFASPLSQNYVVNHTTVLGGSVLTLLASSFVDRNCTLGTLAPGVVYSSEHFALLVAITRHDLHRFANYSCDVQCAARWIQLGAGVYDRVVNCRTTLEHNCSHYAFPIKEDDLSDVQLSRNYSADCGLDRSVCSWAEPENSRPVYYAQMVTKLADGMKQVEQYRSVGANFCYNLPTEFTSSRREEFNATIMHSFRQNIEAGWYFEHLTLATFLEPFCGSGAVFHSNHFHYFVLSLTNLTSPSTNKSIHSYVSSICPAYGTLFPVNLPADLVIPDSYLNTSITVPDIMQRYVSRVLANDIRVYENGDNNMKTILSGDAFKWIVRDFLMMVHHIKDDKHSATNRKIAFYLLVPQMGQMSPDSRTSQSNSIGLIVGLVCVILLILSILAVYVCCYCSLKNPEHLPKVFNDCVLYAFCCVYNACHYDDI